MNKQELITTVQNLMQDDAFKAKLEKAEDLDAMAALFQAEGIQVTGADLEAAAEKYNEMDELQEQDLENVAGGFAISGLVGAAIILFVGGSVLWGYIDGIRIKWKKCHR